MAAGPAVLGQSQTWIVPPSVANVTAAYGAGTFSQAGLRIQEAYGPANFPATGALIITQLRYRPDAVLGGAFSATVADIRITLSTSPRAPDALSTVFAQNVGTDETVVFQGSLDLASAFSGPPGGPRDFDIVVPLQAPFLYDPGRGALLVDISNVSGAPAATVLGGQSVAGDAASRAVGSVGNPTGGLSTGVDALQLVYVPTNAPPRPTLLTRGPYLQAATRTNILVVWRTSAPTNGLVRFGLASNDLRWTAVSGAWTNEQAVTLTNLLPGTRYYYAVGAGETNFAGGPEHSFRTAPAGARPTRIWATGDFGTTGVYGNGAVAVRDAYEAWSAGRPADVWLMLGDNAYQSGTDAEFQRAVFDVYGRILRQTPAWSAIGNHEVYSADSAGHLPYLDIFRFPTGGEAGGVASGTRRYYSFDHGNIHFVSLDSESTDRSETGAMATWLRADLAANTNDWLIAFWHSPPYTKGSHDSDNDFDTAGHLKDMREIFVPILEAHGVDLVLGGHSHNYERSYLIDGHYGKSPTFNPALMLKDGGSGRPGDTGPYLKPTRGPGAHEGSLYAVVGSSGFATFATGSRHVAMHTQLLQLGSLIIDIDGNRMDAWFLRETGAIEDRFTVVKGGLLLERLQMAGGAVTASFKTLPGRTYRVECSPGVDPPAWVNVSGPLAGTGAIVNWTGPAPPGAVRHFYRVVQVD
jgi:hypothetical protein